MKAAPLLLDTGAWLKALAGQEPWQGALEGASECIVPGLVLAELDWHLRKQRPAMRRVLRDVAAGRYRYEPPTAEDLARAATIDEKFKKVDLGLTDASLAALAERLGIYRVLTIDSDFAAVRVGPSWTRAMDLVCPLPVPRGASR